MLRVKYILLLSALILLLGLISAWAEEEKKEDSENDDQVEVEQLVQALILFDQAVSSEVPDVIELGQKLKEGEINPIKSKSGRDNPFDEWSPPKPKPLKRYSDGEIGPLPPPILGPELPDDSERQLPASIVDGVKLVGIMDFGDSKIAILKYNGKQKSVKINGVFMGPVKLILTEIGDNYVVLTSEDGSKSGIVGFSFANLGE